MQGWGGGRQLQEGTGLHAVWTSGEGFKLEMGLEAPGPEVLGGVRAEMAQELGHRGQRRKRRE